MPAIALTVRQRIHSNWRVRDIAYEKFIIGESGRLPSVERRASRPSRRLAKRPGGDAWLSATNLERRRGYCGIVDAPASVCSRFSDSRAFGE